MATRFEMFKARLDTPVRVYRTTMYPDGNFTVEGVENRQEQLLYIADNIGSFIVPDLIEFDPYFCTVKLHYGNSYIEFDSSFGTWELISKTE